ncbi:glycosyltransferase family 2 protein [Intestinibacter sp.]|uniref:glycosyltransferase family 2 protein n=1 Tax=Intestinibacter sp. TaxID=1965304 RepID=UPI002A915CF6|nr:glycosyltransferase family 2 protein [Intestinibacter sp.]MDY5213026.1 glycosyltransferase family 2 protein [Intestinibacter sp.]
MPLFSVIVPIYNVERFVQQCIDSILGQTYGDFELILVNDGSTDKCPEICNVYAELDKRIRVIHKPNGGLVSARNAGVLVAKGEYVVYVDGDDWVEENWLETLNNLIKKYKPDIINYGAYKSSDGKYENLKTANFEGFYDEVALKEEIVPYLLYDKRFSFFSFGILPAVWSKAIKTDILKENICKEEKITFGEDVACTYNCIMQAKTFFATKECLYYYRQNRESMTKAYDSKRFERVKILFDYLNHSLIEKYPELEEQYKYYQLFCIFYAILNESKNNINLISISKRCEEQMSKNEFDKILTNTSNMQLGILWRFVFFIMKSSKYVLLSGLCKGICKIKYSYKE